MPRSSERIPILHVLGQLNRGGVEMRQLELMQRMANHPFEWHFCILSGRPGELDADVKSLGGHIHYCPIRSGFRSAFPRLLLERGIHAVNSHVQLCSGLVLRLAHSARVPVRIAHFQTTGEQRSFWKAQLQDRVMRYWLSRHATHIVGNGEGSLTCGWQRDWAEDRRCAVIHCGVEYRRFGEQSCSDEVRSEFNWGKNTKIIIHVGRMDPVKNHVRLMHMMAGLMHTRPDVCLLLAGRTTPATVAQVENIIRANRLGERVAIAGSRADVPRLLKAANLMIFPSIYEGLPGAVLEACAAGTPVLATDLPGIREIGDRFETVRCLPLAESDETWALAAAEMLGTAETSRMLVADSFKRSVYSIDLCVRAHDMIWRGAGCDAVRRLYEESESGAHLRKAG